MENIAKEFLKKNPKYGKSIIENLGSGYNGSAYLTDKKFVVKITKDKAEYNTTKKIVKNTALISTINLDLTNNKKLINNSYKLFMQ